MSDIITREKQLLDVLRQIRDAREVLVRGGLTYQEIESLILSGKTIVGNLPTVEAQLTVYDKLTHLGLTVTSGRRSIWTDEEKCEYYLDVSL